MNKQSIENILGVIDDLALILQKITCVLLLSFGLLSLGYGFICCYVLHIQGGNGEAAIILGLILFIGGFLASWGIIDIPKINHNTSKLPLEKKP